MAMWLFCRKILVNRPLLLKSNGPLLLASNHPNSFLDAIILDILFQQPVWSLARGDVFNRKTTRWLRAMRILPVYRTSEGVAHLSSNYDTFDKCINIFRKQGVVQIFSEGKCINEWHLRPLKKGTARLAIKTWKAGIPLVVLPVGINYSSFRRFGKNIFLRIGTPITQEHLPLDAPDGLLYHSFNEQLQQQLQELVFELPRHSIAEQKSKLELQPSLVKKIVLFVPAVLGWITHVALYAPVRSIVHRKTAHNDHFDSVMTGVLFLTYPLYLAVLTLVVGMITGSWLCLLVLITLPVLAWTYVQLKPQIDKPGTIYQ